MIGARLGPYEITAKLGEGGMGEVYRARDSRLDRGVAIKVLPAAFIEDNDRLARFEREAKLLARLPDSRRGILRWGDRLLVVDAETEEISTLAEGFHRDGGVARLSADGRWIYMLDAIEEGDVWVASRASESQASE
jgi:serine/threonine protein kinase